MKRGLGDILVEERLIAREQLGQARRAAERRGSPLITVLLEQGLVTEDDLVGALCRRLHMELFDPIRTMVDVDAVREVPLEEANRYRLLPLQVYLKDGRRMLRVAMANPLDAQAIEDIEFSTGCRVEPLIARPSQLVDAIRNHYRGVVTKVIQRARFPEGSSPLDPELMAQGGARSFAGDLDEGSLKTRPLGKRLEPDRAAPDPVPLEALLALLVRKRLISMEEYEEELRSIRLRSNQ